VGNQLPTLQKSKGENNMSAAKRFRNTGLVWSLAVCVGAFSGAAFAQEKSVAPGINQPFIDRPFEAWAESFHKEGREVFDKRDEIVASSQVKAGMTVADIGAGTGLFSRLFSNAVGANGKVYAVDITQSFVDNTMANVRKEGFTNIVGVVNSPKDVPLPAGSVDIAFLSDVYHHFEYPQAMLRAMHTALKPGGTLAIVEFDRIEGVSSPRILEHVREDKATLIKEAEAEGFKLIEEKRFMKQNYFVRFAKQ
jgi:ubiquinone/menaquinone biosynthesis C-methylase UbiE